MTEVKTPRGFGTFRARSNRGENQIFKKYRWKCQDRNIFFGLTVEEFGAIITSNCTYCDRPPYQKTRTGSLYNGIDRLDPEKGYSMGNVVAACGECNAIKGIQKLSIGEMRAMAQALKQFRAEAGLGPASGSRDLPGRLESDLKPRASKP